MGDSSRRLKGYSYSDKCRYCKYAIQLFYNPYIDDFRQGEQFVGCYYIVKKGEARPCLPGKECTVFKKYHRQPSFREAYRQGYAHYGYHQIHKKGSPGPDYIPKPGDIIRSIVSYHVFMSAIVGKADEENVWVYQGRLGYTAVLRKYPLRYNSIIGYIEPVPEINDSTVNICKVQKKLGLRQTGIFDKQTVQDLEKRLSWGKIPRHAIVDMFLQCMGFDSGELKLFQRIEGLEETGVADPKTLDKVRNYLDNAF